MHYVQTKTPLLTIHTIRDAKSRGKTVWTEQTHESMDLSNGGTALGIAVALGEIDMPTDEDVMHSRELFSSVASCSSGVELDRAQIVVVGNARGVGGRYRIGHSVMKDPLDQDGIWAAIRDAGLELPERPHSSDLDGQLVNVFLKCEASQDGTVRGRRMRCSTTPTCTGTPDQVVCRRSHGSCHRRSGSVRLGIGSAPGSRGRRPSRCHRRSRSVVGKNLAGNLDSRAATGNSSSNQLPVSASPPRRTPLHCLKGFTMVHAADPVDESVSGAPENRELVMADAVTLSGLIRRREVSCVEVMDSFLDQIELHNPAVNAIVALRDREALTAEARERDSQLARGSISVGCTGFRMR